MNGKIVSLVLSVFVLGITVIKSQSTSTCGSACIPGIPGVPGNPGRDGTPGSTGPAGVKGEPGERGNDYMDLVKSNWKQCVWKRSDGNLQSYGNGACSRWYFTFNGAECIKPATIEGVIQVGTTSTNTLRHSRIEGYCNQIPKGQVRVGFLIGKCSGYGNSDGNIGWNSMSRIVIEEIPPPQQ